MILINLFMTAGTRIHRIRSAAARLKGAGAPSGTRAPHGAGGAAPGRAELRGQGRTSQPRQRPHGTTGGSGTSREPHGNAAVPRPRAGSSERRGPPARLREHKMAPRFKRCALRAGGAAGGGGVPAGFTAPARRVARWRTVRN